MVWCQMNTEQWLRVGLFSTCALKTMHYLNLSIGVRCQYTYNSCWYQLKQHIVITIDMPNGFNMEQSSTCVRT
jgi:hypothetical protein